MRYNYNIMKTSQSFFPTRTHLKSREVKREKTYQLIKRPGQSQQSVQDDDFNLNIFKQTHQKHQKMDIDRNVTRPIGGADLFRKMEQAGRERMNENRRHSKRSNKQPTQRNISSNFSNNRFRKERLEPQDRQNQDAFLIKPISEVVNLPLRSSLPEETFKSHISYSPEFSSIKSQARQLSVNKVGGSEIVFRPSSSKPSSKMSQYHDEWAAQQRRQYQDKAALLNQINYNRPLVQKYGDRYFQYMLRNRFQQDFKPPIFIYQIGNKKFTQSRAIQKIKKYRPDIKEKGKMVVRGKKLTCDED